MVSQSGIYEQDSGLAAAPGGQAERGRRLMRAVCWLAK